MWNVERVKPRAGFVGFVTVRVEVARSEVEQIGAHCWILVAECPVEVSWLHEALEAAVDQVGRVRAASGVEHGSGRRVKHVDPVARSLEVLLRIACFVHCLGHLGNTEVVVRVLNGS